MAQGDLVLFEEFAETLGETIHDFENDEFKFALVSDTTIAATQATPSLNDFTECTGTGYTSGGESLANASYDEASGVATFDADDVSWSQNASGPTDIRWGVIYNADDGTSVRAVAFIDMRNGGNAISLQDGDISYAFNASGIFTVDVT